jgi:hypothetical protein
MSAELRVGAVGAGWWAAANRLPILKTRRDAEAVAVSRLGSEELHEAQTQFAIPHRQGARQPRRLLRVRRRPAGYPLHHDITASFDQGAVGVTAAGRRHIRVEARRKWDSARGVRRIAISPFSWRPPF